MNQKQQARHYQIHGRVQGVGFRAATAQAAALHACTGWVRNLPNGDVEVFAQGEPECIAKLEEWLSHVPAFARVDTLDTEPTNVDDLIIGFTVRR